MSAVSLNLAGKISLKVAEVAAATGFSEITIRRAITAGELHAKRRGKAIVVKVADAMAFIDGLEDASSTS